MRVSCITTGATLLSYACIVDMLLEIIFKLLKPSVLNGKQESLFFCHIPYNNVCCPYHAALNAHVLIFSNGIRLPLLKISFLSNSLFFDKECFNNKVIKSIVLLITMTSVSIFTPSELMNTLGTSSGRY